MKFGLIGDGYATQFHRKAIASIGGTVEAVYDPKYLGSIDMLSFWEYFKYDYIVICSPTHLHREHIQEALKRDYEVIVEKPMCLPWEPIIDDDRINVVMQLRWLPQPKKVKNVKIVKVRDKNYFSSWKGDATKTGGLFYNLFIHYIDLALLHRATFEGMVLDKGIQKFSINGIDIASPYMQEAFNSMYRDILLGKGVKPKDLYYLYWILEKKSNIYGYGKRSLNRKIVIERNLK